MNNNRVPVNKKEKSNPSMDSLPSDLDENVLRELFDLPNWIDLLKNESSFDQNTISTLPPPPRRMPLAPIDLALSGIVISPPEQFKDSVSNRFPLQKPFTSPSEENRLPLAKRKFVHCTCYDRHVANSEPKKRSKLFISN